MRILIAGASGLVGQAVVRALEPAAHETAVFVRPQTPVLGAAPTVSAPVSRVWRWDPVAGTVPDEAIAWADAVISLNGAPLARLPWTPRRRALIRRSRVAPTRVLAEAIAASPRPPAAWVSASAVGIYGSRPGERLIESAIPGTGFLADVVRGWEAATEPARATTRVVHARTGLVLSRRGALGPIARLAELGMAGPLGSGRQHWPWISLHDEAAAFVHLATASLMSGAVNLAAPVTATCGEIVAAVADALGRPHRLPVPGWTLRAVFGEAARDLLLADQRVMPLRLVADGFRFRDTVLVDAVRAGLRH